MEFIKKSIVTGLVFLSLGLLINSLASTYAQSSITADINRQLENSANKVANRAFVLIYSNTEWSGSILDSSMDSATRQGSGNSKIAIECSSNGIYSLSIQKQTEYGYLAVAVIQDGKLLDSKSTNTAYGIVSLAGRCVSSGCLIATAAFGSELAPQVQFLRGFRDNYILSTDSGSSFMKVFNSWYYSFSPPVANYERQNQWLQQAIRVIIYPLIGILSISESIAKIFSGMNEVGAVLSGITASVLIGGIYLSPLALLSKRVRKSRIDYRIIVFILATAISMLGLSIVLGNEIMMMVTTSSLVLTVIIVSSICFGNLISHLARSLITSQFHLSLSRKAQV